MAIVHAVDMPKAYHRIIIGTIERCPYIDGHTGSALLHQDDMDRRAVGNHRLTDARQEGRKPPRMLLLVSAVRR